MAYSVQDIAKWILTRNRLEVQTEDGDYISNLKLQKLLYYSQGCFLALRDEPLFDSPIEAWTYGPVVPEVYHLYKSYGSSAIDSSDIIFDTDLILPEDRNILEEVYSEFGQYSAAKLVKMTHEETHWISTKKNCVIDNEVIKKYFKENYVE